MQHPADALTERLGLPIRDRALLEQALVHSSWLHEHPDAVRGHNERLEFLGDAVVNLAISDALYRRHPPTTRASCPPAGRRSSAPPASPGSPRGSISAIPPARRGRGAAWRPRPAVAPRVRVRGARRRASTWISAGRRRATGSIELAEAETRRTTPDQPQEPEVAAPGAHPAHDRRASRLPPARGGRAGPREAVPDRGAVDGRVLGTGEGRRAGSPRPRAAQALDVLKAERLPRGRASAVPPARRDRRAVSEGEPVDALRPARRR